MEYTGNSYISNRAVGEIPLSISTSLAIESITGMAEGSDPKNPTVLKFKELWVNVRTLFRNVYGSISTDNRTQVDPELYGETMYNEMDVIRSVIGSVTNNTVKVVFYLPSYESIKRRFPNARWVGTSTPKQAFDFNTEINAINHFNALITEDDVINIDVDLPGNGAKALLLTHYPIDLLSRYKFSGLALLESHTGTIKPPILWYTKLRNGRDLKVIPFDKMTLQLFGDSAMFSPMPIKIRRHLIAIGEKCKWSPATTKEYILKCIKDERDPVLEKFIMDLY